MSPHKRNGEAVVIEFEDGAVLTVLGEVAKWEYATDRKGVSRREVEGV